jgi:hypothetical protein
VSNRNLAGDVGQQPIPAHIHDSRTRTHSIICIAYPYTHEIVDVAIECCFARSRQQYSCSMPQNRVTPHTPFSGHSASPSRQKEGRSPPAVFPPQPSFLFLSLSDRRLWRAWESHPAWLHTSSEPLNHLWNQDRTFANTSWSTTHLSSQPPARNLRHSAPSTHTHANHPDG